MRNAGSRCTPFFVTISGLVLILAVGASPVAHAGFINASLTEEGLYPDMSTVLSTFGPVVVGPGVEIPSVPNWPFTSIDVAETTITIGDSGGFGYSPGAFDGFHLTFTGAPAITGVTLDTSSTLLPVSAILFDADEVYINYAGGGFGPPNQFTLLNVSFAAPPGAVPLPPALWVGITMGAALLVFRARGSPATAA